MQMIIRNISNPELVATFVHRFRVNHVPARSAHAKSTQLKCNFLYYTSKVSVWKSSNGGWILHPLKLAPFPLLPPFTFHSFFLSIFINPSSTPFSYHNTSYDISYFVYRKSGGQPYVTSLPRRWLLINRIISSVSEIDFC